MDQFQFSDYNKEPCRFCGLDKTVGKSLFSTEAISCGILDKISCLFPKTVINISSDDSLSQFICSECELIINYFMDFMELTKRTQTDLIKRNQTNSKSRITQVQNANEFERLLCHTTGVTKDNSHVVISVECNGQIQCDECNSILKPHDLLTLYIVTCGLATVQCRCKECGHTDDIGLFLPNKDESRVLCPRCLFISDQAAKVISPTSNDTKSENDNTKKSYVCEICSKRFRSNGHKNRHKLIHSESKPFLCETCGKCFNQRSTLKTHTASHMNLKKYVCNWCAQSFRFKLSLYSHMLSNHGHVANKIYECDNCSKKFVTKEKLKRHSTSHFNNKNLSTDQYCTKSCNQSENTTVKTEERTNSDNVLYDNVTVHNHVENSESNKFLNDLFSQSSGQKVLEKDYNINTNLDKSNASKSSASDLFTNLTSPFPLFVREEEF
ncbi:zinc finger protein 681-like [Adelges cooleyi]|uniref:zinc finger protein 681-like n=1 Tax=Adelges cooleyi TaxID=133065 RepID=UPI0021808F3A|nr:zinc finger protein 681-like [Adelges cooleyi]